ncbi:hypothetical protein VSS74_29820 [Conexibacter stalactiti]|uniref:Uncharacterized protein n=1 Tax=Conexibacter stalactiti TaxID=1940611 RepID=A0ABU4HZ30_9ACTN|nr:hypothetical protein [Conexibacter stalactiti]MDW5598596.1 hypothetical protein [Conexibacter stalactiti]MEC5039238.1 hypothetical protein [Conexibacter stalactiti]
MPRLTFPRFAVPVLLALSVGLAACGGSDEPEQVDATVTQPRTTPTQAATVTMPTETTPAPTTTTPPPTTQPQTTATQPPATTPAQTTPEDTGGATAPPADDPGGAAPGEDGGGTAAPASSSCGNVAGGFITGVQAEGADCSEASGVASAWIDAIGESGPDADVAAAGFACSGSLAGTKTSVTCIADGGRRVTFQAAP